MSAPVAPVLNIGPRERLRRYLVGFVLLLATAAFAGWLMMHEPNRWIRATVFIPFWFAWLCLFQASAKVCVMHVAKGTCNLDQGTQAVDDPVLRAKLWSRAMSVYLKTTFTATIWTLCTMAVGIWC